VDETAAHERQDAYYHGDTEALGGLYTEIRKIAKAWVFVIANKKRIPFYDGQADYVAHESATRIISLYLRKPGYRVYSFYERVRLEVYYHLFDGGHRDRAGEIRKAATVSLGDMDPEAECDERECKPDALQAIEESSPYGTRIIVDLGTAKNYRGAILRIAGYMPKRWIYDNADSLHTVYRMTRWPKRKKPSCSR
jgi:hypothetical protein